MRQCNNHQPTAKQLKRHQRKRPTGKQIERREFTWLRQIWADVVRKKWKSYVAHGLQNTFKLVNGRLENDPDFEYSAIVNKLTNHQRNKWAGAGYPGLRDKNKEKVIPFLNV